MKLFRYLTVIALVISLFAYAGVAKAALTTYYSGFQVQNLENVVSNIAVQFYNRDGTVAVSFTDSIQANSSNTYLLLGSTTFGNENVTIPNGFDGSVVVSSDTKVAAIANINGYNELNNPFAFTSSYSGFTAGSEGAYLPVLMKNNFGFSTWFSIQNTGSGETTATVTYSNGATESATIKPGAAAKFVQTDNAGLPNGFVGSAKVTTSTGGSIAVSVMEVGTATLFAYDGFRFESASTLPVMPLFNANNFTFVSGIALQNVGTLPTDVTVTYTPSAASVGGAGTACTEKRTIPAGQSKSFGLYVFTFAESPADATLVENCNMGERFVGSAVVTVNSASQNLVAVVNQLSLSTNKGAAYNAFNPADGTATVVFPLIMDRNYGFLTGWNVANAGSAALAAEAVQCTINGTVNTGFATEAPFSTVVKSPALGIGENWPEINGNKLGTYFVGAATCVGPAGSQLVGMVNQLLTSSTDTLSVYEGTNP